MFRWKWIVTLVLALPLAVNAEKPRPTYELEATGDIEINPDGAVRSYTLKSDLKPAIAAIVDKSVRGWKFEPIAFEGKPAIGLTSMRLALIATPVDGGQYALKVANVWFGQPALAQKMIPPEYPVDALYAHLGAKVVLVLKLDQQGNVVDVFPEQTSLTATGNPRVVEKWRHVFERVSIATAKKWKFNMTEKVNGEAIESSVRIPIAYQLSGGSSPKTDNRWQGFVPGPIHAIPWVSPDSFVVEEPRDTLKDGEAQPLTSRFRLKQEVVGTTL